MQCGDAAAGKAGGEFQYILGINGLQCQIDRLVAVLKMDDAAQ